MDCLVHVDLQPRLTFLCVPCCGKDPEALLLHHIGYHVRKCVDCKEWELAAVQ